MRRAAPLLTVLLLVAAVPLTAHAELDVEGDLRAEFDACVAKFRAAGKGALVDQLDRSEHEFDFERSVGSVSNPDWWTGKNHENGKGTGGTTLWNPTDTTSFPGADPCATLYHEMAHLADYDNGTNRRDNCFYMTPNGIKDSGLKVAEVLATRKENEYRRTQPDLKPREFYGDKKLPPEDAECLPKPPEPPPRGCGAGCAIGSGDPHLRTFDGRHYGFHAVGEFVLTRADGGDLEVQGRTTPLGGLRTISEFSAVAVSVGGDRVGFYRVRGGIELRVNGAAAEQSIVDRKLPEGGRLTTYGSLVAEVTWPDGSTLVVRAFGNTMLNIALTLAGSRGGKVEGLFGDFDGRPEGDLTVRGGKPLSDKPSFDDLYKRGFADSWRVTRSLFDYAPGQNTETFTDRSLPARSITAADLPNRATAEATCRRAGVTDEPVLSDCVLDVGLTGQTAYADEAVFVQRSLVSGSATVLKITEPGGKAQLTFEGEKGQHVFVDVPSATLPEECRVLSLLAPDGNRIATGCVIGGKGFIDTTVLPESGTYTVEVAPKRATGEAAVRVITTADQNATIAQDGPTVSATLGQAGAVGRFQFDGTAGRKVFLDVPSTTLPDQCEVLKLLAPDGQQLADGCVTGGKGYLDGSTLPVTGRYTILVDPKDSTTGTAELRLHSVTDQTGTITVNGGPVTATIGDRGATSSFTFTATEGQTLTLDVSASTLPGDCGVVRIVKPDDSRLATGCVIHGKGGIKAIRIPATGQYTLVVDPRDDPTGTGTATLRLHT